MPGFTHGHVAMKIAGRLDRYIEERNLGRVFINDTFILLRRDPDSVRGPDVGYISYERLPREQKPTGMLTVIPELVVEVRSPSDSWTALFAKVVEYLQAGVGIVLVLDAETSTASIYRQEALQQILPPEAELTLPELFPEFRVRVGQLFE